MPKDHVGLFDDIILSAGCMFCDMHCLAEYITNNPEKFLDNDIELRSPEGQNFNCSQCGCTYEE